MNRPRMTAAATALLRALLNRAGAEQHRIFLTDWTSTDWHSLTFAGERHVAGFSIHGPDAEQLAARWTDGLEESELPIGSASFVGDIAVVGKPEQREDGAVFVRIEALTLGA